MNRKKLIILALLSFIFGVGVAETMLLFALNPYYALIFAFLPLVNPKKFAFLSIFIALGVLRSVVSVPDITPDQIAYYAQSHEQAEKVNFIGTVIEQPEKRPGKTRLIIEAEKLGDKEVNGKVVVNVLQLPEFEYGDKIRFYGKLEIPPEFEDFSYKNYLAKDKIFVYSPWSSADLVSKNNGNFVQGFLYKIRSSLENNIEKIIPRPESGFAQGILFGTCSNISEQTMEDFNRTGLTHLLALSGFNITIIIIALFWVLKFLPKKYALVITIFAVIAFVLMTGASASVVRASIMGLAGLLALHSGREIGSYFALVFASFLMVLWNSKTLLFDVSFQLSVAGVLGIIIFVPVLEKSQFFKKLPETLGFKHAISATLGAQIAVAPLSIFYFETFSLVAPLANPLIAPLIPLAMLLAFVTALLAYFSTFLATVAGFIAYFVLKLGLLVADFFADFSFAQVEIKSSFILLFFWLFLAVLVFFAFRKYPQRL